MNWDGSLGTECPSSIPQGYQDRKGFGKQRGNSDLPRDSLNAQEGDLGNFGILLLSYAKNQAKCLTETYFLV
jgi:hypothetical protein